MSAQAPDIEHAAKIRAFHSVVYDAFTTAAGARRVVHDRGNGRPNCRGEAPRLLKFYVEHGVNY